MKICRVSILKWMREAPLTFGILTLMVTTLMVTLSQAHTIKDPVPVRQREEWTVVETGRQIETQTRTETNSKNETETHSKNMTETDTKTETNSKNMTETDTKTETNSKNETETYTRNGNSMETVSIIRIDGENGTDIEKDSNETETQKYTKNKTRRDTQNRQEQTDRQTDIETERQTNKQTNTDRETEGHRTDTQNRQGQTDTTNKTQRDTQNRQGQTDRETEGQTNKQTNTNTDREAERQTDKQTNTTNKTRRDTQNRQEQTDGQTDGQTDDSEPSITWGEANPHSARFDDNTVRKITVMVGQKARLPCTVLELEDRDVSWIRQRDLRIMTVGIFAYTQDDRFKVFHPPDSNDWHLDISSATYRDAGIYECQVSTSPKISLPVTLVVQEQAAKIEGPRELFIQQGSTIRLRCEVRAQNSGAPPLTWHRDGTTLDYDSPRGGVSVEIEKTPLLTTSKLFLTRAMGTDSGLYSCDPNTHSPPATVRVHVVSGEESAAVHKAGVNAVMLLCPHPIILIILSILLNFITSFLR